MGFCLFKMALMVRGVLFLFFFSGKRQPHITNRGSPRKVTYSQRRQGTCGRRHRAVSDARVHARMFVWYVAAWGVGPL